MGYRFDDPSVPRKKLCGLAVQLCGSQKAFKGEAAILKRLVERYGPDEVEKMLRGAIKLGWDSLRALGSAEGTGRRMAIQAFWKEGKREAPAESARDIFRRWGTE